jgi:hypothetical protein
MVERAKVVTAFIYFAVLATRGVAGSSYMRRDEQVEFTDQGDRDPAEIDDVEGRYMSSGDVTGEDEDDGVLAEIDDLGGVSMESRSSDFAEEDDDDSALAEIDDMGGMSTDLEGDDRFFADIEHAGKSMQNGSALGGSFCSHGAHSLVGTLDTKVIPDMKILASSYWRNRADHGKGTMWRTRIDHNGTAWCANEAETNQGLLWDFSNAKLVTQVTTKGRANRDQWVTSYALYYKTDHQGWKLHPTHFVGNSDRDTAQVHTLVPPVKARWVFLQVKGWNGWISMRADFAGCEWESVET